MMSSNSSSTDPADDFPEVDDYSEVDELDAVAAELAAELGSINGAVPEAPTEPGSPEGTSSEAAGPEGPSAEELAAALAQQVGLDLNGESSIAGGPIDLVEQGLVEDDEAPAATARAGWFPPATGDDGGPDDAPGAPSDDAGGPAGSQPTEHPRPPARPMPEPGDDADEATGLVDAGEALEASDDGRTGSETLERVPSSPPIERAPLAPQPAVEPSPVPAVPASDGDAGHPVDQIAVRKLGGFNFLSVGQWSTLPRDERARLLKGGMVMFLYEGDEVATRPALVWLQQIARSEAPGPNDPPVRRRGR